MIGNPTPRTALATASNATVAVLAAPRGPCSRGYIINRGAVDGFYRINGADWCHLPAGGSIEIPVGFYSLDIARVTDGSNLASVWFIGFQ